MYTAVKLEKTRNILLGFQALRLFKKMTGKSLSKLDYEQEDMEDYIPAIFYCGLVHEDKELTLETTIELIDKNLGIKGALELLPAIIEDAFGKGEDIKKAVRAAKK
jgi:hypothetical protein